MNQLGLHPGQPHPQSSSQIAKASAQSAPMPPPLILPAQAHRTQLAKMNSNTLLDKR